MMIDRVENEIGPTKLIGYYIYESAEYEQDSPIGFRLTLDEAEALQHFVAENRCHRIRWGRQRPTLGLWSYAIMPVVVPVSFERS